MLNTKVCGMRDAENIAEVSALHPQYMGFIFYSNSKRFVGAHFDPPIVEKINQSIKKIGVFVSEAIDEIINKIEQYQLNGVQLHGNENMQYCEEIRRKIDPEKIVIKVFQVDETFDFNECKPFINVCDYFLFDTKTKNFGGSGESFDWNLLKNYNLNKPFFLSGGIRANDVDTLVQLQKNIPQLYAVDINSCFETEPGLKNVAMVKKFIEHIRNSK